MREHQYAPMFRNTTGSRLRADDISLLRQVFEARLATNPADIARDHSWLQPFLAHALAEVPFYRRYRISADTVSPSALLSLPTIDRGDLSADIAAFVPDDVNADELITYVTSGTTGHRLHVPSHPRVAAQYLLHHRIGLRRFGLDLSAGSADVGIVILGYQLKCFTYVSVTPMQGESGLAKINLHPSDWRDATDRGRYLEALNAEVISGDPLSFAELLTLPETPLPRALFCTSMALLPGLRRELEARYRCPVLDFYSMNEAGPIAVFDPVAGGHVVVQDRLLVEILGPDEMPVQPGERGEITITGGFNFCLPLVRYRTGDTASLSTTSSGEQVLVDLIGRQPVRYLTKTGAWLNNLDLTHALADYPMAQYSIHQRADHSLRLMYRGREEIGIAAGSVLEHLFEGLPVDLQLIAQGGDKVRQFTSDVLQAHVGGAP
jgi:phenylacetate-CoA ligase